MPSAKVRKDFHWRSSEQSPMQWYAQVSLQTKARAGQQPLPHRHLTIAQIYAGKLRSGSYTP